MEFPSEQYIPAGHFVFKINRDILFCESHKHRNIFVHPPIYAIISASIYLEVKKLLSKGDTSEKPTYYITVRRVTPKTAILYNELNKREGRGEHMNFCLIFGKRR